MTTARPDTPVVLTCTDLEEAVAFFRDRLGFRVDMVMPADDPRTTEMSGQGLRVVLQRRDGPNLRPSMEWKTGRAGMQYRDLIPDRLGGRIIASHIRITEGGPVPDSVHFHDVRFQMIFCVKGWVRLVYERQGPPFVLEAGDCVLQPPQIRHRVLEASPGLEVVEIACPASHPTYIDHDMALPTADVDPEHRFGGQRFVRHQAGTATWRPWRLDGFECRDTGIGEATDDLASVLVVRRTNAPFSARSWSHDDELFFAFVLDGSVELKRDGGPVEALGSADAYAIPAGMHHALQNATDDLQMLVTTLPGA